MFSAYLYICCIYWNVLLNVFTLKANIMNPDQTAPLGAFVLFVWFDSLRPINNLSVKQGRVFLG